MSVGDYLICILDGFNYYLHASNSYSCAQFIEALFIFYPNYRFPVFEMTEWWPKCERGTSGTCT